MTKIDVRGLSPKAYIERYLPTAGTLCVSFVAILRAKDVKK